MLLRAWRGLGSNTKYRKFKMEEEFTFPFEIVKVPANTALEFVQVHRSASVTPIIVGGEYELRELQDRLEDNCEATDQELIAAALATDGSSRFYFGMGDDLPCCQEARDEAEEDDREYDHPEDRPHATVCPMGKDCCWLTHTPYTALSVLQPIIVDSDEGYTHIAMVPTSEPWEVGCLLRAQFGNSYIEPHEHAAVWREWYERFGAVPVSITSATVEFVVEDPPTTREAALDLALEHFAYCQDDTEQGVGYIEALAATLLNGRIWHFWWD